MRVRIDNYTNTMNTEELMKNTDLEHIATQGSLIYKKVKNNYKKRDMGKFLAINIDSKEQYLGNTSLEAVAKARKAHPNKVFYVVKIGFDAAETMVNLILRKQNG
jgi:hypothetical protein